MESTKEALRKFDISTLVDAVAEIILLDKSQLTVDAVGEWIFSFDKKQEFNLFADYPHNLTAEQVQIFDKENPEGVEFFEDRKTIR